jgi:type IV secretion system protein TrbD
MERVVIHRSLNRPVQFLGADRELALTLSGTCIFLAATSYRWEAVIFAGLLWFLGLWGLRALAKADPLLRQVYLRHRRYRKFYAARSTPWCNDRRGPVPTSSYSGARRGWIRA